MQNNSPTSANLPSVSILIPTFNGRHLLEECLPTLAHLDYPRDLLQTVVFDNGSSDGTSDFLRSKYPDVVILRSEENLFFAPAINRAVQEAQTEVVAFLNNDMKVQSDWLEKLVNPLCTGQADCVASTILDWEGRNYQFVGGGINFLGQGFEHGGSLETTTPEAKPLLFACGGAMAVRRSLFLEAGAFDEDYRLLYEDVDFGWRLNLMGYRVVLSPLARVFHRAHASVSRMDVMNRVRILERNALFTLIKNYQPSVLENVLPVALLLAERRAMVFTDVANKVPLHEKITRLVTRRGRFKHKGEAIHAALDDVACHYPVLLRKRTSIQDRRRVSDDRIFPLFCDSMRVWAYENDDYRILEQKGYPELLSQLCSHAMDSA
ncbi:MAG TPA: glycosyltransferase family 2 protein [bacterium]|nr:glycosyltransferase family 2 protein [bacterium]